MLDFCSFKFINMCFMAQYMAYLGIDFLCVCCCWIEYSINVNLIKLTDLFRSSIPLLFSPFSNYAHFLQLVNKTTEKRIRNFTLKVYNGGNRVPCMLFMKFSIFACYLILTMKRMYEKKGGWEHKPETRKKVLKGNTNHVTSLRFFHILNDAFTPIFKKKAYFLFVFLRIHNF